jgi:hypothetical protein
MPPHTPTEYQALFMVCNVLVSFTAATSQKVISLWTPTEWSLNKSLAVRFGTRHVRFFCARIESSLALDVGSRTVRARSRAVPEPSRRGDALLSPGVNAASQQCRGVERVRSGQITVPH